MLKEMTENLCAETLKRIADILRERGEACAELARVSAAEKQGISDYLALQNRCDAWRVAADTLRAAIEDFTIDGCTYADDCPANARHYRCHVCRMTDALDRAKKRVVDWK